MTNRIKTFLQNEVFDLDDFANAGICEGGETDVNFPGVLPTGSY